MPARKNRIPVVLDTNVVIANYLGKHPDSTVKRVFNLWRKQRRLQLVVSEEVILEYLIILDRVNISSKTVAAFSDRIEKRQTVSKVSLGKRPNDSRDPKDNLFLATALAGSAEFLITLDKDLLEIPESDKKKFRFKIMTPADFLRAMGA